MKAEKLFLSAVIAGLLAAGITGCATSDTTQADAGVRNDDTSFATTGRNPYCVLEPGYQLVLDGKEEGKTVHLVIIVLNETKNVGGVETRVVEERESHNGELVELSRNYFAIGNQTRNLCYFGEDVDTFKHGKVNGHEGSWHHGTAGARYGIMVPAESKVGDRYHQENAPGVAQDAAETVSVDYAFKSSAGSFTKCMRVKEGSVLELGSKEYKVYAPGIGLVQDDTLALTSYGFANK